MTFANVVNLLFDITKHPCRDNFFFCLSSIRFTFSMCSFAFIDECCTHNIYTDFEAKFFTIWWENDDDGFVLVCQFTFPTYPKIVNFWTTWHEWVKDSVAKTSERERSYSIYTMIRYLLCFSYAKCNIQKYAKGTHK